MVCSARYTFFEMSLVTYVWSSDILETTARVIVQQCNCVSRQGSGLYASILRRYPRADFYSGRTRPSKLGTIENRNVRDPAGGSTTTLGPGELAVKSLADPRWVCAFYAQYFPGKPSDRRTLTGSPDNKKNREIWFAQCLDMLAKSKPASIAFPYGIGCGLAEGDWSTYEDMILKFAENVSPYTKVYIVSQEPDPNSEYFISDGAPIFDDEFYLKLEYMLNDEDMYEKLRQIILGKVEFSRDFFEKENFESVLPMGVEENNVSEDEIISGAPHLDITKAIILSEDEEIPDVEAETLAFPAESYTWENSNLLEFTVDHHPRGGWEDFFQQQLNLGGSISDISDFLTDVDIFPPLHLVYECCNRLKLEDVKVIFIGQDPYHGEGQAMGVAFAVPEGVPRPPSLVNLFKEATAEGIKISSKADASKWVDRGVLMINTALTVHQGTPGSHSHKWMEPDGYTQSFMRYLDARCGAPSGTAGVVVVMLGNHAKSFDKYFGVRHRKIHGVHPSPLSAHKGFFGSNLFLNINKHLVALGYDPIDWSL
jgi:uracil-DNA glycosylase